MRGPRREHGRRVLSRGADAGPHRWRPTAVAALEARPYETTPMWSLTSILICLDCLSFVCCLFVYISSLG